MIAFDVIDVRRDLHHAQQRFIIACWSAVSGGSKPTLPSPWRRTSPAAPFKTRSSERPASPAVARPSRVGGVGVDQAAGFLVHLADGGGRSACVLVPATKAEAFAQAFPLGVCDIERAALVTSRQQRSNAPPRRC